MKEYERNKFKKEYTSQDIQLLAKTAQVHDHPNEASIKKTLERMVNVYKKEEYQNITHISVSHIYNLKKKVPYSRSVNFYQKTKKGKGKTIGLRCKPKPEGKLGYLRVDTMHQGDQAGQKRVYHINTVDEVIQWEVIGATAKITDEYLLPLLEKIIASYPYRIINFHVDNGSEYINRKVAEMLNHLLIKLTKGRPRHTNASATIGPIFPPSIPMVLIGSVAGISIGRLFIGGIVPGILLAIYLSIVVYIIIQEEALSSQREG